MSNPRQEDWREVLLRRYAGTRNGRLGPLQVMVNPEFLAITDEAAKRLDVNRSTMIRRSVAVQAAATLGIRVHPVLALMPSAKGWQSHGSRVNDGPDLGDRIELWCPHPGCDGGHLNS